MSDSSLIDRVLARARAELDAGVREATGHNDGVPSERYCGGRQEPWCAAFVAWLFREEGQPLPGDVEPSLHVANPIALVATMEARLLERQWLRQVGERGDIVFFAHRQNSDAAVTGRHVGIIESCNRTTFVCVEGNCGDRIQAVTYLRARTNMIVTSYGRVPEIPLLCAG